MKRILFLILLIMMISMSVLFSGCAASKLYGTWQLTETLDANTMQKSGQNDMFQSLMAFSINRDKTVTFLDQQFGTYERSGNEFTFTYTNPEQTEQDTVTGAYELKGSMLRIYIDDEPVIYHFIKVDEDE